MSGETHVHLALPLSFWLVKPVKNTGHLSASPQPICHQCPCAQLGSNEASGLGREPSLQHPVSVATPFRVISASAEHYTGDQAPAGQIDTDFTSSKAVCRFNSVLKNPSDLCLCRPYIK